MICPKDWSKWLHLLNCTTSKMSVWFCVWEFFISYAVLTAVVWLASLPGFRNGKNCVASTIQLRISAVFFGFYCSSTLYFFTGTWFLYWKWFNAEMFCYFIQVFHNLQNFPRSWIPKIATFFMSAWFEPHNYVHNWLWHWQTVLFFTVNKEIYQDIESITFTWRKLWLMFLQNKLVMGGKM